MLDELRTDARKQVLSVAAQEASRRGDGRIGTEHLLLALLDAPGGVAQSVLGIDIDIARTVLDELDRMALAFVGFDLGVSPPLAPAPLGRRRSPLTSGARAVLHDAVLQVRAVEGRRVETRHLLMGLLGREPPDPAAELLAMAGVDRAQARARLAELPA